MLGASLLLFVEQLLHRRELAIALLCAVSLILMMYTGEVRHGYATILYF